MDPTLLFLALGGDDGRGVGREGASNEEEVTGVDGSTAGGHDGLNEMPLALQTYSLGSITSVIAHLRRIER